MSENNAKTQLTMQLVKQGIFGEEAVEAEVKRIVEAIPSAIRGDYPEDTYEAALKYADTYYATKNGATAPAPTGETGKASTTPVATAIPAAELRAINEFQNKSRAARADKASKTRITKLLGDKPYPGEYIQKGATMVPKVDIEKFKKYRDQLVQDEDNIRAYEECLKAIESGSPMEIYIPERSKWSPRLVGAKISTPGEGEGSNNTTEKPMTTKQALGFVAFELCGYIPCDATTPGAKLGACKPNKKSRGSATGAQSIPRLIFVNRKEAFSKPDQHEFVSKVKEVNGKPVTKEATVRSNLSFVIDTGKKKQDQTAKTRRVRVSGKAAIPEFVRSNQTYEQLFGAAQKQSNVVTAPSEADRFKTDQILNETLFALSQSGSEYGDDAIKFQEKFNELTQKSGVGAAGAGLDV